MSKYPKQERWDNGPDAYQCDNCGCVWTFAQLSDIPDLMQRVDPGTGTMPCGECPDNDCGALCYPVDPTQPSTPEPLHPQSGEPTNEARAARVKAHLTAYALDCYSAAVDRQDHLTVAQDYVNDVCHWLHRHHVSIEDVRETLDTAYASFVEEVRQEG